MDTIRFVATVRSPLKSLADCPKQGPEGAPAAWLEFDPALAEGLDGIKPGARCLVLTWFHQADRSALSVHPRGDPANPRKGVFATRSPDRPNPIGLHPVTVRAVDGTRVQVTPLEALDGTPVVDMKILLPSDDPAKPDSGDSSDPAERLRSVAERAWSRGLLSGFNGNLSLRQGGRMVITASGCAKATLGADDLALVALDSGQRLSGPAPSSETPLHLAVYANQPAAAAVVHTHPPHLLALDKLLGGENLLDIPLYEAEFFAAKLTTVPAIAPGTSELAAAVGAAAASFQAVLMRRHGLVAWGESPEEALCLTEELESLARVRWLALAGGGRPEEIVPQEG